MQLKFLNIRLKYSVSYQNIRRNIRQKEYKNATMIRYFTKNKKIDTITKTYTARKRMECIKF